MAKRWQAATDRNQSQIVRALRDAGCSVFVTSNVAGGFPDIVVGLRDQTYLLEIKTKRGKLTPSQVEFFGSWRGHAVVVRNVEEALRAVGLL